MNWEFSLHTIIFPVKQDAFLIYNLLTRSGVLTDSLGLTRINQMVSGDVVSGKIKFRDLSTFSLSECLLDNPNGLFDHELNPLEFFEMDALLKIIKDNSIIVKDNLYLNRLGKKENLFDKVHNGNFHQQIGDHVRSLKNIDSEMWWINQKFSQDYKTTTDTPYKWVQEIFMKNFFTGSNVASKSVLDFGCGIGYYSKFFSDLGADVLAVDPSENYIQIAKKQFSANNKIEFRKAKFTDLDDFREFDGKKFDIIFLSDVFLYYFEPYKKLDLTPSLLLSELSKILKEDGKIYIMDPHGIFHLQPWFNKKRPFVIALEYATRRYRVTPNLEEVSLVAEEAGFFISKIRELKYNGLDEDKRFYSEFPFWWFFELCKLPLK